MSSCEWVCVSVCLSSWLSVPVCLCLSVSLCLLCLCVFLRQREDGVNERFGFWLSLAAVP